MKKWAFLCAALLILAGCSVPAGKESPPPSDGPALTPSPGVSATGDLPGLTATPVPAESASPAVTPAPAVSLAPETTPEPSPSPVIWNGDLNTLTAADFPTVLSEGQALLDLSVPLHLVAQFPDLETWLYGLPNGQGLILRVGGDWQLFDLAYLSPSLTSPTISYGDYDNDMELELALRLHVSTQTGSVDELHILELGTPGQWADRSFSSADYRSILEESVTFTYDETLPAIFVRAGDSSVTWDASALPEGTVLGTEHPFGDLTSFYFDGDTITASFSMMVSLSPPAEPVHIGTLSATVLYTGTAFGLTDFNLSLFD